MDVPRDIVCFQRPSRLLNKNTDAPSPPEKDVKKILFYLFNPLKILYFQAFSPV